MSKVIPARPRLEFISYESELAKLCCGTLTLKVDEKIYKITNFLTAYGYNNHYRHGGQIFARYEYCNPDYYVKEGYWEVNIDKLPEELRHYVDDIGRLVNWNIEKPCRCAGMDVKNKGEQK